MTGRRILRFGLLAIAGLLALVVIVIGGLATPPGRALVTSIVEGAASGNGLTVSISGLSGWPPFHFGADKVVLTDTRGSFAEIDGLNASLDTGALLGGRVTVTALTAAHVAFERTPQLPGSASSSGSALLLPFAVQRLQIARLDLGAGIVGKPASVSIAGGVVSDSNGRLSASLIASRLDGIRGELSAKVERDTADAPLSIDITADEAPNGILVGAIGRSSGPGYHVAARTGYTAAGLDGTVSLTSEGDARFAGRFSLAGTNHLTVSGEGNLADLVPPAFADLLGGPIALAVDADWTADANGLAQVTVRDGRISTGTVRATVSGTYGGAATDLSLRIDAAKPGGGALRLPAIGGSAAQVGTLALSGRLQPKGNGVRLDLVGHIGGLTAGEVSVPGIGLSLAMEADGKDPLSAETLPFALRIEVDAVNTASGKVTATPATPILLTADGTFDTSGAVARTNASLAVAGGRATFAGTVGSAAAAGDIAVAFADLTGLSPLAGRSVSGGITATATGTLFGDKGLSLAIAGKSTNLVPGDLLPRKFLTGEVAFAGNVAHDQNGRLSVSKLDVKSQALSATGDFTLDAATIAGNFSGTIADLGIVADGSNGAATFVATLGGSPTSPKIDAAVNVARGTLLSQAIENATIHVTGGPETTGWRGQLALDGSFAGRPLSGRAEAALDTQNGGLSFPAVDLTIAGNRITGALARTADGLFNGTLAVEAPNLKSIAAFADVNATGTLRANVKLAANAGKQAASTSFVATQLVIEDIPVGRIDGQLRMADTAAALVEGSVTGSGIDLREVPFDTASIKAVVSDGAMHFELAVRGPDVDLNGIARLADAAGVPVLQVDALTGTAYKLPIKLAGIATVGLGRDTRIANANFILGTGRALLEGLAAPQLDLKVTGTGIPASVANAVSPGLGAEGTINGTVTIVGNHKTRVSWNAVWSDFRVASTRSAGLPGLSLAANGIVLHRATSVSARLGGAGIALDISGTVPFTGATMQVRVRGTAPLALAALLTPREMRLGGTASVDLTVAGTTAAPAPSGTVDLAGATVADALSGVGITAASGRIRLSGTTATIERLSGNLIQGGTVAASGSVSTDARAGLPANLGVRIDNGRYIDGNTINTSFTANLKVSGPLLFGATVSGAVDLGHTEILLPDKFGGPATALDVRHVNTAPGFVAPAKPAKSEAHGATGSGDLRLDIQVNNRAGISVRGFGVDAELGGSLNLRGTSSDPVAVGAFTLQRGRLDLIGHRFDMNRGTLTFSGDLIPVVDFAATNTGSDVNVTVLVTGRADDPQIAFTSSPSLPQEEVLSHLLFGKGLGSLSPVQAAQLLDSIAQLSGAFDRGNGFFDRVRRATGLDDLDIRQNATGGTVVGLGRRLGDNLRVGVEQDTQAGKGKVTIDLDIAKNLKARGEAGQDGSGKFGLTLEHEY